MKSAIAKRSVSINSRKTSVSLEDPFWEILKEIAGRRGMKVAALIDEIKEGAGTANLSSAIRLYVLADVRRRCDEAVRANARADRIAA